MRIESAAPPAPYAPPLAWHHRLMAGNAGPVLVIVIAIIAIWYVGTYALNAPFQRDLDRRGEVTRTFSEFIAATMSQPKPTLPAPHQVAVDLYQTVFLANPTKNSSLIYHSWVTLSSTLLGFALGTLLGIAIAVAIVHSNTLDRSLMPWIIASQTIPILAIAPMVIVVLNATGFTGYLPIWIIRALDDLGIPAKLLVPKALISTYLAFFPVTVGMVKGLRSPDPILRDLMRTYSASASQVFWKLRVPASVPFLFASMQVAIAISLVGAIVGELPTGAAAGIGSRLLFGSYYSQTVQLFSALIAASVMAALLVTIVGMINRIVLSRMGTRT